jgi:membrane-associated protease RseP (regulator of RpoE activity)
LIAAAAVGSPSTAFAKASNPAFLGVQMSDIGNARGAGPCRVTSVTKDSAAESAGMQDGDELVSMDGKLVPNCDALVASIQAKSPGDVVKLVVRRDGGGQVTVRATLVSRDEILRKRFGGLPVPSTKLVRVDDRAKIDLSGLKRQTTIVGWYPTNCDGCDQIFTEVAKWSREERRGDRTPIKVTAATAGDLRMRRPIEENLEMLKHEGHKLDVPLLVADADTYEQFAIGDGDRVQFMVIDCRGIVQYAAPVVPGSEDAAAVLDELFAVAEQTARRK